MRNHKPPVQGLCSRDCLTFSLDVKELSWLSVSVFIIILFFYMSITTGAVGQFCLYFLGLHGGMFSVEVILTELIFINNNAFWIYFIFKLYNMYLLLVIIN